LVKVQSEPLGWEELLASVKAAVPQPVREETAPDGSLFMTGGEPGEVVVRLTDSSVTVWEFAIEWQGPHTTVAKPIRFGSVQWKHMPAGRAMTLLSGFIGAARESRRSKYLQCRLCEETKPPEWMHEEDVCQGCAEKHLGVVY
jgi:hypothetical protein